MDQKPFFIREPKWQIVIVTVIGLLAYIIITNNLGGPETNQNAIILDVGLFFLGGIILWTFFFGQFVLPVRSLDERVGVFSRLMRYILGEHGPVTMIKNGETMETKVLNNERGPGVIILDTASAAMLRSDVRYTRPVGPGVTFTRYNAWDKSFEYIANAIDLRRPSNLIGPSLALNEDPFAPKGKTESDPTYAARQDRRIATSAWTRDGIEVVASIFVAFQLNMKAGQGNTGFGYDGEVIRQAAMSVPIEPGVSAGEKKISTWNQIPGVIAVDIWRETLHQFSFEDLFQNLPEGVYRPPGLSQAKSPTAVQFIQARIKERMTQNEVIDLDEFGRQTGRGPIPSREYKLLTERGIKVLAPVLVRLYFPRDIEEKLVSRWVSTWLLQANFEKELIEQQLRYINERSYDDAIQEYASIVIKHMGKFSPDQDYGTSEVISELLQSSLHMIIRDAALNKKAIKECEDLIELVEWAKRTVR
jgi:hypothetical protein